MLLKENDMSFICFNCGPYPDLWIEKWSFSKREIVKVAVAQHNKGIAKIIHIINMRSVNSESECGDYPFCWSCFNSVPMPIPSSRMKNYLDRMKKMGKSDEE